MKLLLLCVDFALAWETHRDGTCELCLDRQSHSVDHATESCHFNRLCTLSVTSHSPRLHRFGMDGENPHRRGWDGSFRTAWWVRSFGVFREIMHQRYELALYSAPCQDPSSFRSCSSNPTRICPQHQPRQSCPSSLPETIWACWAGPKATSLALRHRNLQRMADS